LNNGIIVAKTFARHYPEPLIGTEIPDGIHLGETITSLDLLFGE
jgi:hypothetical protein